MRLLETGAEKEVCKCCCKTFANFAGRMEVHYQLLATASIVFTHTLFAQSQLYVIYCKRTVRKTFAVKITKVSGSSLVFNVLFLQYLVPDGQPSLEIHAGEKVSTSYRVQFQTKSL